MRLVKRWVGVLRKLHWTRGLRAGVAVAAAMMMGLPVLPPGAQGEDPGLVAVLDMGSSYDRDLEDLRDEFRPKLGERFEGWCKTANETKGSSALLTDAHMKAVKSMPFLKASDVVHEMLSRYVFGFVKGRDVDHAE